MKSMRWVPRVLVVVLVLAAVAAGVSGSSAVSATGILGNKILAHQLDIELGRVKPQKWEQPVSSGAMYALLGITGELDKRADAAGPNAPRRFSPPRAGTLGCPNAYVGNGEVNNRVNRDCSYRRQAEEVVAINPTNRLNLVAGQNDSRIGFNHCGYDFSFDGGKTWGDMVPPFYGYIMPDGHTADACSDPTATFDSGGNAYIGGILFDINSAASSFVVAKSNAPNGGQFYHTPADLPYQEFRTDPLGIVAADNDPNVFHDKEFIVADANPASPKKDTVYATWTRFAVTNEGVGADSPIYFSQSTDGGATWSPGIEISGANPAFCTDFSGQANPNACDQDQGSHPFVGPDGTLYVGFANGNTPTLGINNVLLVSCPATADCSNPASWTAPSKAGDTYWTLPFGPDPNTGCPPGRQCVPPNGYRTDSFTSISVSVDRNNTVYLSWEDSRNLGASCNPLGDAATATGPCDTDVRYAYSTDKGATWSPEVQVTPPGTAQWMPWSAVAPDGGTFYITYYDRRHGDCETTGCNDITVAKVRQPTTATPKVSYERLTTSSMPNLTTANNPIQAGFLGDYMWVATDATGKAYVVWADTRGLNSTIEEDIYFTTTK